MSMVGLKKPKHRLGVPEREDYHQVVLKDKLEEKYQVRGFPDMLLSRRSKKTGSEYCTCISCRVSLRPKNEDSGTPPTHVIANGFTIGEFPEEIMRQEPITSANIRKIDVGELTNKMRAIVAPVWPYGWGFAYAGGVTEIDKWNFAFFETVQSRVGRAINHTQ